jgi:hypothetical protein
MPTLDPLCSRRRKSVERREFLRRTAAGALGTSAFVRFAPDAPRAERTNFLSGRVAVDEVLRVGPGEALRFDPDRSTTVTTSKNVVVEGLLEMRPSRPGVVHTFRFVDVDEGAFRGGGLDVLGSDVGLWVMGNGRLDIAGTSRKAWNRKGSHRTWRGGDELVLTPTDLGDFRGFRSYGGGPVPTVNGRWKAEVLNLTRNVRIQGTPSGRSHILIRSTRPSTIKFAEIRHMGPRKGGRKIAGRWPVHFHHAQNGSRGSMVQGVVVRDGGSHAFVAHASHGVTFKNCIAYDVMEDAFWWDHDDESGKDASNGVLWDRCVAALVRADEDDGTTFHILTGFRLENGKKNVCRNCVAVGVQGGVTSSGFHWPEDPPAGVWGFKNNRSHNNRADGAYAWMNDNEQAHDISGLVAYRNGKVGMEHGAYGNKFRYTGCATFQDGAAGAGGGAGEPACLVCHAHSISRSRPLKFKDIVLDGAGVTPRGIYIGAQVGDADAPAEFVDLKIRGVDTVIEVDNADEGGDVPPGRYDFVRLLVGDEERDLRPSDIVLADVSSGTVIRAQRKDNRSAWRMNDNGDVSEISPFA